MRRYKAMNNIRNTISDPDEKMGNGAMLERRGPLLPRGARQKLLSLLSTALLVAAFCFSVQHESCASDTTSPGKSYVCTFNAGELEKHHLFGAEPALTFKERREKLNSCAIGGAAFGAVVGASATLKIGGLSAAPAGAAVGALTGTLLRLPACYQEFMKQPPAKEEALDKCNVHCKDRYEAGRTLGGSCEVVELKGPEEPK